MTALRRLNPVFVLLLLAATLGLRIMTPAGFMPVADENGIRVQICSGAGMSYVEIDPGKPDQDQPRDPCPYGLAMAAALDVPQAPVLADPPEPAIQTYTGAALARLVAARILRPPARGPPLIA
ncbi:MAG TPA: hypothetical protein PK680_01685 [Novosphingobium sp.]|nr:hypothetical protein [Novosphingobium sp.]HQA17072.1 hypothetical protein [Novosphingobium sp.]